MSEPVVRTSTQLWSQAVRAAEAESELDAASATTGVAALLRKKDPGYEFSNDRKFDEGRGAYE